MFKSTFKPVVRNLTFTGILAVLASCATPTPQQAFPDITFNHLTPLQMSLGTVSVETRYVPPLTAPNVEHRIPVAPLSVLQRWPRERIGTTGGSATAGFIITKAEVLEQALDVDGDITAIFTNEQAFKYQATVEAIFTVSSDDGLSQGQATAHTTRSVTIPEDATLNEREQLLFTLVESTLHEFDKQMTANIHKHLAQWVR